jgi:phosphatidylglycerophosphatase A
MTPDTEAAGSATPLRRKPHISFLLATWFGVGYLPKAPGTWGSLAGVLLTLAIEAAIFSRAFSPEFWIHHSYEVAYPLVFPFCCLLIAAIGVGTSSRVAAYTGGKDPQFVVVDEVSGQMLALLLGVPDAGSSSTWRIFTPLQVFGISLDWQIPVAAFLLFRLFDIWKPWPIRKLEKLPGGWGIMADDWLAGIYAAILLRLALHFNVL